jgi:hypothetical protein
MIFFSAKQMLHECYAMNAYRHTMAPDAPMLAVPLMFSGALFFNLVLSHMISLHRILVRNNCYCIYFAPGTAITQAIFTHPCALYPCDFAVVHYIIKYADQPAYCQRLSSYAPENQTRIQSRRRVQTPHATHTRVAIHTHILMI